MHHQLTAMYMIAQSRRGLIDESISRRHYTLSALAAWLDPTPLLAVTREQIEAWLDSRAVGARTRYWHLSNLSCFFRWAVLEGYLEVDPTMRIIRPRLPSLLPRPIAEEALQRALRAADERMRCWLLLAAYGGLRAAEIAGLSRADVLDQDDPPTILVRGKGDKERLVPLHPQTLAALWIYGMPSSGWLWVGQRGAIKPNTVTRYITRYLRSQDIAASTHNGRHYFGTQLYRDTKDIRLVQELMGHAHISTTAIYTKWDQSAAMAAVRGLGRVRVGQPEMFPIA